MEEKAFLIDRVIRISFSYGGRSMRKDIDGCVESGCSDIRSEADGYSDSVALFYDRSDRMSWVR